MASAHGTRPERHPPSEAAGTVLGILAGCLLVGIWLASREVGFAVTIVFAGLAVCLLWGVPGWRRFGAGLVVGAVVAAGVLAAVVFS